MKTRPWIDVSDLAQPAHVDAQTAIDAVSQILFSLSGEKYAGIFQVTEQYICETTGAPTGCWWDPGERAYWNAAIGAYAYVQDPVRDRNRLMPGNMFRLRGTPVKQIVSVSVSGSAVPSASYELVNSSTLVATDTSWGLCSGPVVTYTYGVEPPALGKLAARKFADEFLKSIDGTACDLPSSVTSVSRQGLSFEILDPQEFLKDGRIGVYEVDLFLSTVNPGRARKRPRVYSPDLRRPYRRQ